MPGNKKFLIVFILIVSSFILINAKPIQAQKTLEVGWIDERAHVKYLGNNTYRTRSWIAPQVFWNNATGNWSSLYLLDRTGAANPHYVVRNAHISARVGISTEWEQEGVLYYDPNFTKPRAAEFWTPQAYIGGSWETLDTTFFTHELEYVPDQIINITGIFRVWREASHVGWLRISYILTPASFLKHEIVLRNIASQTFETRVIMSLMGITGRRIENYLGSKTVTFTDQEIEGYWFKVTNSSNPAFIFLSEKLDDLGTWVMNETTGEEHWENQYLRGVKARLFEWKGRNLTRVDIAIGNYTLATGEEAFIDPDTSTWQIASDLDDRNVYEGESAHPPWNTMQVAGANALRAGRWSGELWGGFMRFDGITIPDTATIQSAYFGKYCYDARSGASDTTIWLVEEDDPSAPTTVGDYNGLDRTEATTTWNYDWTVDGQWETSPDLVDEFQEVIDMATWDSGDAIIIQHEDEDGSSTSQDDLANQYYRDTALAANLTVTWSVPTGEYSMEFSESITVNGEVESWRALYRGFSETPGGSSSIESLRALSYGTTETLTIEYEFWTGRDLRFTVSQTMTTSGDPEMYRALLREFEETINVDSILQTTMELEFVGYETVTQWSEGVSSTSQWKSLRFTVIHTPTISDVFSGLGAYLASHLEQVEAVSSSSQWKSLEFTPSHTITVTDDMTSLGEFMFWYFERFETAHVSSAAYFVGLPDISVWIAPLLEIIFMFIGSWYFSLIYWVKHHYREGFLAGVFWISTGGIWLLIVPVGYTVALAFLGVGMFILLTAMLTLLNRLELRKYGDDETL